MRSLATIVMIAAAAICFVPRADATQASDAPLSPSAIADLFKESASLGKEESLLVEEANFKASERKAYVQVERPSIESERAVAKASNSAVIASCDQKDWDKAPYLHCRGMIARDDEVQAKLDLHIKTYNLRIARFDADEKKLIERDNVIRARLNKIQSILDGQKAFTDAVDKCDQLRTMEAQSQCMQKQIDGAGKPKGDFTIDDPDHITVVAPKSGGGRTPAQAIEDYINSGPPKPVLRPSGEKKKEPPPPGQ